MGGRTRRRAVALMTLGGLVAALYVLLPAQPSGAAAPTPTPARAGNPTSIAVIGDSISTATGTGRLGAETPANSWVTGNATWSMRGLLGINSANAFTMATNGRRMEHFDDQASALPASTQYVVVELGGNDLCRPSVAEMTSEADYRAEVRKGLAAVAARVPNALVFLAGVPDIYNLWYLRGAPSSVNPYVADETHQATQARLYWDNPLIDIIPCQSLLENPTSTAPADEARRQQVRARNQAFNQILREECAQVLRCRHDGNFFFSFSSNRATLPDGPYLPRNQWAFTDRDISHDTATGCPFTGLFASGCGDHFHPSLYGQQKLATAGHTVSYQWATDATAPTVSLTPDRMPNSNGRYTSAVDVAIGGADAAGVRGFEVRLHQPNGTVTPWIQYVGAAPDVTVSSLGQTYVEARALDNNGNQSASTSLGIFVEEPGTLAGTVRHRAPGPPGLESVAGVEVTAVPDGGGTGDSDTTDALGHYDLTLPPGDYDVQFADAGDHIAQTHDTVVAGSQTTTLDALLQYDIPAAGFPDVDDESTDWAKFFGLVTGFPDGTFQPSGNLTRGQIANMLWNLADVPPGSPPHGFPDVAPSAWFGPALDWARDQDLVTGYPDGTYRSRDPVNRGQLVNMIWHLVGAPTGSPPHGFDDVRAGVWYEPALDWARAHDLVNVIGTNSFEPKRAATRVEVVLILHDLAADDTAWPSWGPAPLPHTVLF